MVNWTMIVEPYIPLGEDDILLLVGSAVLPWGKLSEELDLVMISPTIDPSFLSQRATERLSEQDRNGFQMLYINTPSGELDIEVWQTNVVHQAIGNLGTGLPTLQDLDTHFTTLAGLERKVGLDLLHYLFIGQAHPSTRNRAKALVEMIDWERYFAWNRDYHLTNVLDSLKGIRKSLRDGFTEEAYVKACWAFDHAVDAMIFHNGISINKWKWRLRYLDVVPEELQAAYREVRFGGLPESKARFEKWLGTLEKMAQHAEKRPSLGGVLDGSHIK